MLLPSRRAAALEPNASRAMGPSFATIPFFTIQADADVIGADAFWDLLITSARRAFQLGQK